MLLLTARKNEIVASLILLDRTNFSSIQLPTCKQGEQHLVCEQIQWRKDLPLLGLMNLHIKAPMEVCPQMNLHLKGSHSAAWFGCVNSHLLLLDDIPVLQFHHYNIEADE